MTTATATSRSKKTAEPNKETVQPSTQEEPKPEAQQEQKKFSIIEINDRLGTINIKGKDYVPVNQRVLGFRDCIPLGKIITEMIKDDGKTCTFKATVYDDRGRMLATGHAFESKEGRINSTSYIENCETSAVGRALGFLGIGIKEAIASAEEVQSAITSEPEPAKEKPIPEHGSFIGKCRSCGQRYEFKEGTTLEGLRSTPCCDRPDWVVE